MLLRVKNILSASTLVVFLSVATEARVVTLRVERREIVLGGKSFGVAGSYEKLVGNVEFALDPAANPEVVDLALAPRNSRGEVEFTADFCLLKPVDPSHGNGRLLYEVVNRGEKVMLYRFQKANASSDPKTPADFGDGYLMSQGYSLLWMGWQWDVPAGGMQMNMPIATDNGKTITGLIRGNFILNAKANTASVTDRNHKAYPVENPANPNYLMTVHDRILDPPVDIPARNGALSMTVPSS